MKENRRQIIKSCWWGDQRYLFRFLFASSFLASGRQVDDDVVRLLVDDASIGRLFGQLFTRVE